MASISVKVPVAKVLAALEKKVAEIRKQQERFEEFVQKEEEWKKSLIDDFAPMGVLLGCKVEDVSFPWRDDGTLTITLKMTAAIRKSRPKRVENVDYSTTRNLEEIENAIRILKMTDDEYVSASTFRSVSKYL